MDGGHGINPPAAPEQAAGRRLAAGGLYLLAPPLARWREDFPARLEQALQGGGVACLQIRLKFTAEQAGTAEETWRRAAGQIMPAARRHGVPVLLNDDARLAAALGADGVHIGQQDGSIRQARDHVGSGIVGATCHDSLALARAAQGDGADYVAFGSFFASPSKPEAAPARLQTLAEWRREGRIPCAAIGGITPANGLELLRAGADFLAVSNGVWQHEGGPGEAVRAFAGLFAQAQRERQEP